MLDPNVQFAQATLNLLRHVVMSAPLPVIQALKDQLEVRYETFLDPLNPGIDFLVQTALEGEFETILPMVEGMLQTGVAPAALQAFEEAFSEASASLGLGQISQPRAQVPRSVGRAYCDYFKRSQQNPPPFPL